MMRYPVMLLLSLLPFFVYGAGAGPQPLSINLDLDDKASLQRGARYYINFCMGCHSLDYMRYERMGKDLDIPPAQLTENLLFSGAKIGSQMTIAMNKTNSQKWFGVAPPDLSVIARSRNPNWLYSYLITFYRDDNPTRPFGVNNVMFTDVGMPHVLWSMQGIQDLIQGQRPENTESTYPMELSIVDDNIQIANEVITTDGEHLTVYDTLEISQPGALQSGEFRKRMRDLVNFLVYVGEPSQLERSRIAPWVMLFLVIMMVVMRRLYKEYWKDVH